MAVKLDLGGVVFTDDEMRAKREIGAFVYVSDPLSGAPRRPAWGMRDGKSKVYATVAECLTDNDRGWSGTGPEDKLTSAPNIANDGVHFELKGTIGTFEGSADIALVNVSDVTEKIVLKKSARTSGSLDVVVDIPNIVKPGDCIAIKDVGGGCGFSTDEIRAKDEFGAFLVAFTNAPKVFATSAACLQDLAANGGR